MKAQVGDRLLFHGKKAGAADHSAEVLEVRGPDGGPPYLVRSDDGHERLVYPGTDCSIEQPDRPAGGQD
jgi:hypothetical protein